MSEAEGERHLSEQEKFDAAHRVLREIRQELRGIRIAITRLVELNLKGSHQ